MRVRTIALNTFGSFLRDRLLIVLGVVFVCTVLLMMTPLLAIKAMAKVETARQEEAMVLEFVSVIMSFVSGTGSLLAAWCAADSVASEVKSGTILAVMARPVKRWEFLLGKYTGVMLLMSVYVIMMFGLSWLLAWIGGQRIQATPWVLLVYPMVRYAVYSAMSMALVTALHPITTMGITIFVAVVAQIVQPMGQSAHNYWQYLRVPLWVALPSTSLLSEERFLTITHTSLARTGWLEHITILTYGLDYALVLVLIAIWSFHSKSLTRN